MKKYSIKDIANLSGVSVATVSRVINNNGRFSEETRKKVLSIIEETNYQTNYSAKSLRTNKSYTIGILVPDIKNYFFSDIVQKIEEILFEQGYTTIICNTARSADKEEAYLQILQAKNVDGIIIISGVEDFSIDTPESKKIPYICIDREPKDKSKTIFISSDHYQGAFDATKSLIDSGCMNLAIVMYKRKSPSSKNRLAGFKDALKKNHLVFDSKKNLLTLSSEHNIKSKLVDFLGQNPQIDGIFAINDTLALELNTNLIRVDKEAPKDIKLIGFDDTPYTNYSSPTLSSVRQDTRKLSKIAVKSLLNLIDTSTNLGKTYVVPVKLINRESSQ